MIRDSKYYNKCCDIEQEYTKKLANLVKGLKVVKDKKTQMMGIDAYYGNIKIDFKFITSTPLVEVIQENLTTWCTKKHDGNILIWFINPTSGVDWLWYLKDLVRVKRELLSSGKKPYTVPKTGTKIYWMNDWLTIPTEVRRPFNIDLKTLEEK